MACPTQKKTTGECQRDCGCLWLALLLSVAERDLVVEVVVAFGVLFVA